VANAPTSWQSAETRSRFEVLAAEWERSTAFLSSIHQVCMHRAYQQIIGMGPAVLPLIFERMEKRPGHWFWALQAITGEDAVTSEHHGSVGAMTTDWLDWARVRKIYAS
jgi:hypothetical protein